MAPSYSTFNDSIPAVERVLNADGLFAFDPQVFTGLFLESGRQASNRNGPDGRSSHAKPDSTGFIYFGRSYGAGSAAGFSNITSDSRPLWYEYTETGIVAQTLCERNESSDFHIEVYQRYEHPNVTWGGTLGYTFGSLADGHPVDEPIWLFGDGPQDLFAINHRWDAILRQSLVAVASAPPNADEQQSFKIGMIMPQFGQVQCRVSYSAHEILTRVNMTNSSIEAVPGNEVEWPDWADLITWNVNNALISLSRSDNGFAGSRVGIAMAYNALTYMNVTSQDVDRDVPDNVITESLADFVTSVIDNMFVLTNAGRIQLLDDTEQVPALLAVNRVILGEPGFIYAIFILNWLIVLLCVCYIVFMRAWMRVANLDFTDLGAVILGTSKGGSALFEAQGEASDPRSLDFNVQTPHARWPAIVSAHKSSDIAESVVGGDPGGSGIVLREFDVPRMAEDVSQESVQTVSLLAKPQEYGRRRDFG